MKFPKIQKEMSTKEKILYIIEQNGKTTMTNIKRKLDGDSISHPVVLRHLRDLVAQEKIRTWKEGRFRYYEVVKK